MSSSQAQPATVTEIRGERLETAQAQKRRARRRERFGEPELPPVQRISMAPRPLERRLGPRPRRPFAAQGRAELLRRPRWRRTALRRRLFLAALVLGQTTIAAWSLTRTFPSAELTWLQIAVLGTFAVLFSWISFSFWSNVAGFMTLWRKAKVADRSFFQAPRSGPLRGRTAVLMPICEEDAGRCFRAIEAMASSLHTTHESDRFDFFVLSDTTSEHRLREEEQEWRRITRAVAGCSRVYYRRRRINIKRKSGNIADFLRRWSRPYDYMIVLDADSLMTGEALVALARAMDASPQIGILQTTPTIINGESLFSRVQQFASRVYGPLFGASLHYWQLGESYYWGHNAILRIAPFVRHCGLSRLPGRPPLGGEILSHDFVEAALMGRAGYEVWLALDLPGSYEESPPTLLDELKRDRRWCQGNLQHCRLLLAQGLKTGHRAILAMGIMAYVSALCWAVFLFLTSVELTVDVLTVPNYFPAPSLFPNWPKWNPEWAIALASTTAILLFLPKFLSFLLIVRWGEARRFGGALHLAGGIMLEILVSALLAPSRMWFHARFVAMTLLGRQIPWNAQQRAGVHTGWREAAGAHGTATLSACLWVLAIHWFSPAVSVWVLPVAVPLMLSIPLSVFASSPSVGRAMRRAGLFVIPEERFAPPVLEDFLFLTSMHHEARHHRDDFHRASIVLSAEAVAFLSPTPDDLRRLRSPSQYQQSPTDL